MDTSFFTEPHTSTPHEFNKIYVELEAEADRRLERFAAGCLRELGEKIGAGSLDISIKDARENRVIISAKMCRNKGSWLFKAVDEDASIWSRRGRRKKPDFFLRSQFHYMLGLPHRWTGMMSVEFPGIVFISTDTNLYIQKWLADFSRETTIVLMERQIARLEAGINEEKEIAEGLRVFVAGLSKELYCLSAISNALGQSHNVEVVLTKVLETTLPIIGARFGVIFFPATGQCVTLRSPRTRSGEENLSLRYYFESIMKIRDVPVSCSFRTQCLSEHNDFPHDLRFQMESDQIETVLEFCLAYQGELVGLGLLGYKKNLDQSGGSRLLMIVLNMIGLFLQQISLMGELERQVKLISQEKLEMEKRHRFLIDHVGTPFVNRRKRSVPSEMLLDEMERARNMSLLAELASGVAHQIRNPLSNLVYGLHLIKENGLPLDEKNELFDSIIERVQIMNRMINEFVQYTRLPALKFTSESVNIVLSNTLKSFNGWLDLSEIHLTTDLTPDLPLTQLDIFLIDQAFHNVVKNAVEAMPKGGQLRVLTRKLKLRHGPKPHLEFAEIVFEDDGSGIANDDLEKVMKPFFSKKTDGMGLGLSLVDHIVRAHGGAVNLENRSTGGTRVRIYLPIR